MATITQRVPRRFLANSGAIFGGEALARLATFAIALIVARQFGPDALGQYGYAVALASILLLIPDLGLNLLTVRELAANAERLQPLFWSVHWLKFCLAGGVVAFTLVFGEFALHDRGRRLLLYVLVARVALQAFSQIYMAIFKAYERMHYIALQQFLSTAVVLAAAAVALALHANLVVVVAALVAGQAAETWLGWRIVQTNFVPGPLYRWDSSFLRAMLVASAPIGITGVLQALNLRLDVLSLSLFASNRELGIFQAAAWFPVGTYLFAALAMTVLFPKLSRLLRNPSERGNAYVESLLKNGVLLVTLAALSVWIAAPQLLRFFFGSSLSPAATTLRILAATLPFIFVNTTLFYVFVAAQRPAAYIVALATGVGAGAVLNLSLAARYGANGNAMADLAREFIVSVIYLSFLARADFSRTAGLALLRAFSSAAILALVVALLAKPNHLSAGWPAAWNLFLLAATVIFLGTPRTREWVLLTDDNL
jgi:O-antigen/teichoic acid export membrane protein